MSIEKVISGGQTGADQGGLLAAWERGIPTGGFCPAEYRTNLGPNPLLELLGLEATNSASYGERTLLNVERSDVTVLFGFNLSSPGSQLTLRTARELQKPIFLFEFPHAKKNSASLEIALVEKAVIFIADHHPRVVNVAGNRDTDASLANFRETRRLFGCILDLIKEQSF